MACIIKKFDIDLSVLNNCIQKTTQHDIKEPLSLEEFSVPNETLIIHKASGLNDMLSYTIKVLDDELLMILFLIYSDYFNNNIVHENWQCDNLEVLPHKGDFPNPDNWRWIYLLYVASKLTIIVITVRFQKVLGKIVNPLQFGAFPKTGCPKHSFSLSSFLQLRKAHDHET